MKALELRRIDQYRNVCVLRSNCLGDLIEYVNDVIARNEYTVHFQETAKNAIGETIYRCGVSSQYNERKTFYIILN